MGSCKLPYIVKMVTTPDGRRLMALYPFTYLVFRKVNYPYAGSFSYSQQGTGGKRDPERNWSAVSFDDLPADDRALLELAFSASANHYLCKLYRATKDLGDGKSDGIGWHQDNGKGVPAFPPSDPPCLFSFCFHACAGVLGRRDAPGGIRKFRDLHSDFGFEDYVLYGKASDCRWLQVFDPETETTYNLLLPSGALVTMTALGNRTLWHCVPKDTRAGLGDRISVVARFVWVCVSILLSQYLRQTYDHLL